MPNLKTLVVYDIDPLCYPDDISLLLLGAKKLENLKLHWSPRMRENGEESINLTSIFGRNVTANVPLRIKRLAIYNLYTRYTGDGLENIISSKYQEEITLFNSMGASDPMTVFLDDAWRVNSQRRPTPHNLKMFRTDHADKDTALSFAKFTGLERLYLVSKRPKESSKPNSTAAAATPDSPATATPGPSPPAIKEHECRSVGSEYLAVIQTHHRTMRHLLLSEKWRISDTALYKLCQSCPNLEQLGFSCNVPPLESLRQIVALVPKLWVLRMLVEPGSSFAEHVATMDADMHGLLMATEFWKPEYLGLKYVGFGDFVYKLGEVVFPSTKRKGKAVAREGEENSMNARMAGPMRRVKAVSRESVAWIELWGMDSGVFETGFP
jgi:hypothetical protein